MYIRAAKTEAEEAGISTEGMANSVSELREEILSLTGNRVDIMLDDDSFKSTYKIIEELSKIWGTLSETTQANITELIGGGVRNANVINALMANMSTAAEVVEKTSNSAGSAMAENSKVLESIQGKINVFKAMFQEFSQSFISSGFVKDVVDFGTKLMRILLDVGVLIEKLGGLNRVLMITAGIIATIKADSIVSFFTKIGSTITNIIPATMSFVLKLKDLPLAMRLAKVAGKDFSAALNAVGISASTAQIAIGALIAILSIAAIAINDYNRKQEKTRRDNIDNAKTAQEEADSLRDLIDQYKELARAEKWDETARDQVKSIQEQITKLVGAQAGNLDLVNGKLDEEIKKLDEIALKTAEGNTGQLEVGKKSAEDSLIQSAYSDKWNSWAQTAQERATINVGAYAAVSEIHAVRDVLKELSLDKYYGAENGIFQIDISSIDSILQSYNDMIKLQEHLAINYKEEISTGGDLNDFYYNLSERINQMRTAVEDYNNAISAYNQNEAVKELGNYLKTNDIDSKEDFGAYINSVKSSTAYSEAYKQVLIDLANNTFPQFADSVKDAADEEDKATTATNKFATALSKVNKLAAGLDQLDSIYADIYDKKDFDWSSILGNEDFTNAFGGLGDAYDDFIKTVANSPDDINACQDAFNKLATAYIVNSGALKDVTDDTRNATIAMLEQKGVANAAAIVDEQLALNKETARIQSELQADATHKEVLALYNEETATRITTQAIFELAIAKIQANNNAILTSGDILQLEALASAAGASTEYLINLANAKALLGKAEALELQKSNMMDSGTADPRGLSAITAHAEMYRKQAEALLNKEITYEVGFTMAEYTGAGGGAGGGSGSKEETWFERQLKDHQHLVKMEQESEAEYLAWLSKAYPEAYKEGIIALDDIYKYQQEVFEGLRDIFMDSLGDVEHEISMRENYDGESKKIIELYEGLIKNVEKEITDARARGLTDEDDYIQELQKKWQDYTSSIKDIRNEITDATKDALDELVDYRIDMLKREIEDEKDSLDERLDNLKEFYDKQKEMLKDQRDEENYAKDQADKRKSVTDLQAELAMLENDDSAWAQKRKLELKEEIATAQEDLDKFEKDHALDLALDALDKAYNDQEAQLQAEMDALEERLNDPEALYNKALEDIRKNSENQLYYQMLMYNRQYGDGNDETVKDIWESAFGALNDYEKLFGELYQGVMLENETGVEDEGGWDDENISGTNPNNQTTTTEQKSQESTQTEQQPPPLTKGGSIQVKSSATHFSAKSKGVRMASYVPGGTYTVYQISGDEVLIGRNGVYTGWINKSDIVGYKHGTDNATPGWHELFEGGLDEYIFTSNDGSKYRMFSGLGDKVLNGKATNFLYDFATTGGSVLTKMLTDLFRINGLGNITKPVQAIEIHQGDVIVQGNANMKTVSEIRRAHRDNLELMLKELNRLNK